MKSFTSDWEKLQHDKFRVKFCTVILPTFIVNKFDLTLRNHDIGNAYLDCRSLDVTGDIRAIYQEIDGVYYFLRIGTHSHLYG